MCDVGMLSKQSYYIRIIIPTLPLKHEGLSISSSGCSMAEKIKDNETIPNIPPLRIELSNKKRDLAYSR